MSEVSSSAFPPDEESRATPGMEQWRVHGHYTPRGQPRRFFAVTFIRYRAQGGPGSRDAHVLHVIAEDSASGWHGEQLQVDPPFEDRVMEGLEAYRSRGFSDALIAIMRDETARAGLPGAFRVRQGPSDVSGDPARITWGSFTLSPEQRGAWHLEFTEPSSGRRCAFRMQEGGVDPFSFAELPMPADIALSGYAGPRRPLRGSVDGEEEVQGEAWTEYQGISSEALAMAEASALRRDDFTLHLDDGRDVRVWQFTDGDTGEPMACHALVWDGEGRARQVENLSVKPLRHGRSSRHWVRCPTDWQLVLPLEFSCLEINSTGAQREVPGLTFHGASGGGRVRIHGTVSAEPTGGWGFSALYGYGALMNTDQYQEQATAMIHERLEQFLPRRLTPQAFERFSGEQGEGFDFAAYDQTIAMPAWDLIDRRGKFWRPIFGLLMLEALGVPCEPYVDLLALPVELVHTGALIIDDIEDSADIRRGAESIHLRYGMDVAINTGSTLYFLPLLLIDTHPLLSDQQRVELHAITTRHFIRAHLGQASDIYGSRHLNPDTLTQWMQEDLQAKIFQTYAYKTASAVTSLTECALVIARELPSHAKQAALGFARDFGVGFQIIDDVLNFTETSDLRKTCGEDLVDGKLTYVIYRALQMLDPQDSARLREILCSPELRRQDETLREGIGLVRKSGALQQCAGEGTRLFQQGWSRLAEALPPSWPKWLLYDLCTRLIDLAKDV